MKDTVVADYIYCDKILKTMLISNYPYPRPFCVFDQLCFHCSCPFSNIYLFTHHVYLFAELLSYMK